MAKKALLIGVNKYKIPGADLRGCVNDVRNIKQTLIDYFDFSSRGIKTLLDGKATKTAIESGLKSIVKGAKRGDVVLIHFSGHGSNVPDKDGDEADNRDEILCPTNLDWKKPLLDDTIRKIFDSVDSKVNLTVIFDCCHSGSATRQLNPPDAPVISRYLPSPYDLMAVESGRALRGTTRRGTAAKRRRAKRSKDVAIVNIPECLITGCRDNQTSADAKIGGDFCGALSYNLMAAIRAKRGKLTYRELHAEAKTRIKKGGFNQVPQLEGRKKNLDRPFLEPF